MDNCIVSALTVTSRQQALLWNAMAATSGADGSAVLGVVGKEVTVCFLLRECK